LHPFSKVLFDLDGRVEEAVGKGSPKTTGLLTESQLRRLLAILDDVTSYDSGSYNPRTVIRAVNELQPLGKEKALAVIEEFLRVIEPEHGHGDICSVLRVLFDVPDEPGYMPKMFAGDIWPSSPKDEKLVPRFPISIEGEIPFLLTDDNSGDGPGPPPRPQEHIDYFRRHGRLRARPLQPTDKPLDALTAFVKSPRWKAIPSDQQERVLCWLREEVLDLLDSVYQIDADERKWICVRIPEAAAHRQRILSDVASLKICWSPSESRYTFLDGRSLASRPIKVYRREIWMVPGCNVKFALARQSAGDVSVEVMEWGKLGPPRPKLLFKVYKVGARDKAIGEFRPAGTDMAVGPVGDSSGPYEKFWTTSMQLPEGVQVQVELSVNNRVQTSPVLKP
jgi:hypothetical protein